MFGLIGMMLSLMITMTVLMLRLTVTATVLLFRVGAVMVASLAGAVSASSRR